MATELAGSTRLWNSLPITLLWFRTMETRSWLISLPFPRNSFLMVVVQQVEDAAEEGRPYDYVLVCVKVIPELYELADVIADVVTPSHTCILLNTTTTIGVEKSLGTRFPKNLIVSLVNFAELNQTGGFEFEHLGDTAKVWIGTALRNETIPEETQQDMAESLALTLEAGNVDCHVSHNILQQQWEKMMGYHPFGRTLTNMCF